MDGSVFRLRYGRVSGADEGFVVAVFLPCEVHGVRFGGWTARRLAASQMRFCVAVRSSGEGGCAVVGFFFLNF